MIATLGLRVLKRCFGWWIWDRCTLKAVVCAIQRHILCHKVKHVAALGFLQNRQIAIANITFACIFKPTVLRCRKAEVADAQ